MNRWALILATLLVTTPSCGDDTVDTPAPTPPVPVVEMEGDGADWVHPPVEVPGASKGIKRLTTLQLARSIPQVAGDGEDGPISWTFGSGQALSQDLYAFGLLDRTLGRPDYIQVTDEPAVPTPLYLKFVDDMARQVCSKIVSTDVLRANDDRVLVPHAPLDEVGSDLEIRDNLRYLKLRFWGEHVPDGDDAGVAELEQLYRDVVSVVEADGLIEAASPSRAAWQAVCVALFSSPAFHLY